MKHKPTASSVFGYAHWFLSILHKI